MYDNQMLEFTCLALSTTQHGVPQSHADGRWTTIGVRRL